MADQLVRRPDQVRRLRAARDLGLSPRRFHGWEPATTQRGYDQDGRQIPIAQAWEVVTEREPEWDDDDRAQILALAVYESRICACGFHDSLTNDRGNGFTFDEDTCPVCAGAARYARVQQQRDEQHRKALGKNPDPTERLPEDGRRTFIRQMSPDEIAARKTTRKAGG